MYACLSNELNSYVELEQKFSGYFDNHRVAIPIFIHREYYCTQWYSLCINIGMARTAPIHFNWN